MTSILRRPSFNKTGYWVALSVLSIALVFVAPVGPFARPAVGTSFLFWLVHLSFPLVFCSFAWCGPLWGLGSVAWLTALAVFVALVARQASLLWIPVELAVFGWICHHGVQGWQGVLREGKVRLERIREEVNTLLEEIKGLQQTEEAIEERLRRHQRLRQIANAFHLTFPLEDLMECVVQATSELVDGIDQVLLYLVGPETLDLELKKVWRKAESSPVKAKHGDLFDRWVLRQGQPLLVEDVAHDFRFDRVVPEELGRRLGSVLVVPLTSEHRSLGLLRLESAAAHRLGADELRLVRIVGDLTSLAIENSRLYSRMAQLAMTDDLTGLAVREYFLKELEAFLKTAGTQRKASVLLIDIDRFKDYNDQFGHSAGDKLLKQIGALLQSLKRPSDAVARYGGEEFVCLFRDIGPEEGTRRAEQIRARVDSSPVELRRTVTQMSISIGLASFPEDGKSVKALLQAADRRLYKAKSLGRNQVCIQG